MEYHVIMTLTEVSARVRRLMPYVILSALIFLILFYAVRLLFIFIEAQKSRALILNPIFGKVLSPFPKELPRTKGHSFTLDTIEGEPVTSTRSAKVFFIPPTTTRFGYREKIFLMAQTFGINTNTATYKLSGNTAVFSDSEQKLTIDITNFNFTYEYQFDKNTSIFDLAVTPLASESEDSARTFLQNVGRYPEELSVGGTNVLYWFYDKNTKTIAKRDRNLEANMVEIDFFRSDIDGKPVVTPRYPSSQNFVFLVFTERGYRVLKAQIKFFERSEGQVGAYPLKSGQQAYQELSSGHGVVIAPSSKGPGNVAIRKMFLAYFDPQVYHEYLQPVYVFLGEGDFASFVPAVANEYLIE